MSRAFVHQVRFHELAQGRRIAGMQLFHHLFMLLNGLGPAILRYIHHEPCAPDAGGQHAMMRLQDLISGACDQRIVDVLVGLKIGFAVARLIGFDHRIVALLYTCDLGITEVLARPLSGQLFQHRNHRKGVFQLFKCHPRDPRPTIGQKLNEPLRGQHLEGLTQGGSRYPKRITELFFRHLYARLQNVFDNQVAQPFNQLFVQ